MRSRPGLVALTLLGCSPTAGPRLVVHLILPDSPSPADDGLASLQITVAWDGGDAGVIEPFEDGGLELPLPAAPVDVTVVGLDDGGTPLWRGLARGVDVPSSTVGGPAIAVMLFGRIGSFSSFDSVAAMPPLAGSAAVSWADGRVVISGGQLSDGGLSAAVWVYDPRSVQVSLLGQGLVPRAHHLALPAVDSFGNPAVLLAGGDGPDGVPTGSVELFGSDGGVALAPLSTPQREPGGATAEDGRVLIGCGSPGSTALDAYLPFGTLSGPTPGSSGTRALPDGGPCALGQVTWQPSLAAFVVGDGSEGSLSVVDLDVAPVDPWSATPAVRTSFAAVATGSGILQFGGLVAGLPVASYELDSDAGSEQTGTLLNVARADFGSLQLPNGGGVLVVGGEGAGRASLASAELFDPENPLLAKPVGSMARGRIRPAVADISGYGAALVVSGEQDGGPVAGLEIYTY